jgi:predicted metalloendopeptidase
MPRNASIALAALALLVACEPPPEAPPPVTPPQPSAAPEAPPGPAVVTTTLEAAGLDGTALDRSVDPCTDFYQFACGNWLARTEIPADKPLWGRAFSVIADRNEGALRKILDHAASAPGDDPVAKKIGAYYGACMDEAAIEADKAKPLQPLLAMVKKVRDEKSLSAAVTELHKHKIWALFDIESTQDKKDATRVIGELDQNGLGLPDRDYYLKDDPKSKETRATYLAHVERMMHLAGASAKEAKLAAEDVLRIETKLAESSMSRVDRRNPKLIYNKIDLAGIGRKTPRFLWDDYLKGLGAADLKDINVTSPRYFEDLNKLLAEEKPAAWQRYLSWHVVRSMAGMLPKAFVDESFTMESSLSGQKEQRPRYKRCISSTDAALGELLAQEYVKEHFSGASKEAMERYVHEIGVAFREEVGKLDWMDPATKQKAIEKLEAVAYLIGFPKKWRTYDFEVKPRAFAANALAARWADVKRDLAKVGKPVDREEWRMTPPTVNAYYEQSMNHMVFPAGILQPPFFSATAAIPVNLGGMGMVVGHELTHGFDDKGALYDAKGNLVDWWTKDDGAKFKEKTDCVADQYSGYQPLPGVSVNGRLTLGENIADLGGIKLAFHAYRAMRRGAQEVTKADGFTEDQQFFLGTGQAWCTKSSEQAVRLRAQVDSHSPPKFRVNGPLSNLSEFAEAFSCKAGAPMRRANACNVW